MGSPTRFPNGVTNVTPSSATNQYGLPDPTQWYTFFNDFDNFTTGITTEWTETVIGTGTAAVAAGNGGLLVLTNSAADNDGYQIQKVPASFVPVAGKRAIFKTRFKLSDVTQSDFLIGLNIADTTLLGATAGDGSTDGIFFQKDDGSAVVSIYCQKDTTTGQNTATVATLVDDTFVELAWYYNGVDKVYAYVDDALVTSVSATSTYLPDAAALTVSAAMLNGAAAAKILTIDYILAAQER